MMMVTSQMVDLEHTVAFHKPILAAIEQRNAALASKLMTAHLKDAANLLMQTQEQEKERLLRDHMATTRFALQKNPRATKVGPIKQRRRAVRL
jgi:GntR family transcriptional repressor for pyruvate dehydrogenase complex